MELIDVVPEFNLYEEHWKIYTQNDCLPPNLLGSDSVVERSILGEGSVVYGEVRDSVIGPHVLIGAGAKVNGSIIMKDTVVGAGAVIDHAIIADGSVIGENAVVGTGEYAESELDRKVYCSDLVTIGDRTIIPDGVRIGRNTAIAGATHPEDYPNGELRSGGFIVKAGDQ